MTETDGGRTEHLTPDILADLADPAGAGWSDERILAHLGQCRHCMAIYAEFGRAHVQHGLAMKADLPPHDLFEAGKAIASRAVPASGAPDVRRRIRFASAAAAVVAGVLLAGWGTGWLERPPAVAPDLRHTISESLREDSYQGLLYDRAFMPRARGTRGPVDEATNLTPLVRAFTADESSADVAFWLVAGLLAEGRGRDADSYLSQALARFPADARLRNLAAILAYKNSELVGAERELREALRIERSPAYVFNLARVLEEQGRFADAKPLWEEVLRHPDAAMAALAAQSRGEASRKNQ